MNEIIRTTADLRAACDEALQGRLVALDTEFVWRRTYRPQLGIVQLGTATGRAWAIDCMTALDPAPLGELLADGSVVKVLHDARQDLTHLYHWTAAVPRGVFDTQLAAAFAGFPAGIGLQKLLFEAIGVGLAKTETCTDWTQRPLSPAQVGYALDDVRYLGSLRDELVARAREFGTEAWLCEEQTRYDGVTQYLDCEPYETWKRIKTRRARLDGRARAILREVAACREELARKWNLPRAWVGDDGSLLSMAQEGKVGRLVHRLRGGQGDTARALYAEAVRKAQDVPEADWPEDRDRHYLDEVVEAADAALEFLAARAAELHVDPAVIASRATVTAYVDDVDDETNPLASGWRHETVGREIAERFGVA